MSATSYRPTNRQWLRRLLSAQPHQVIGGAENPYLLRWYVIPRNPVCNIYLHKFLRSDDDRALHDHPWWFVSLILWGGYTERTEGRMETRRAGSIAFRRAEHRHRVILWLAEDVDVWTGRVPVREQPCWTLIVTGRRTRLWGFWCKTAPWKLPDCWEGLTPGRVPRPDAPCGMERYRSFVLPPRWWAAPPGTRVWVAVGSRGAAGAADASTIITGPPDVEPRRVTYYQGPDRFIPWTEFGDAGCGEPT